MAESAGFFLGVLGMVTIYEYPYDIPKTYYGGIGEVMAKMALVEHQIMLVIGHLLKLKNPKQVRVGFLGMTMKARIGAMNALAKNWAPTTAIKNELSDIASGARNLSKIRNSFAHGIWCYPVGQSKRKLFISFSEESKDFYMPKAKHYKSTDIIAKAKEVRALIKRLKRVLDDLKAAP